VVFHTSDFDLTDQPSAVGATAFIAAFCEGSAAVWSRAEPRRHDGDCRCHGWRRLPWGISRQAVVRRVKTLPTSTPSRLSITLLIPRSIGIPRGSRSALIATLHQSRKVLQVQTVDRSTG
jgi:hypothetical protein